MHIQIINFNLSGLSQDQYEQACEKTFAAAFARVEGLLSKVWLANAETNTFGGVYTWRDKQAMLAFQQTELFKAVATNPQFANLNSRDFAVLEGPTRTTRGAVREAELNRA